MDGHVCESGHCLNTLSEQHRQQAQLYGRLSMSDKSGMELVADFHGVTEVNLITALVSCSKTSSIESLERLRCAHGLVTSLSVKVFPGALQTEQKIGGWREALGNEMNLKESDAYHRLTGSKHLVGSSSAPYCNSRYPTHMMVMDARTQQVLVDQFFSVPKCVRFSTMSEGSYDLLTKIIRAVPKRSEGELQDVVMKPLWCPHPNAGLIWDMTADITLDLDDDASLHDLAMIHHLLAIRVTKQKNNPSTEPSEGSASSDWLRQGTCLAHNSGTDGHVCNSEHCLITLSEQHRQLTQLYGRLRMSDKSGMELIADCHGVTEINLITALGFYSMTSSIESLERLERANELVTPLSVQVFPEALQTE